MAMKLYICDVHIIGRRPIRGMKLWLPTGSLAEVANALTALFPVRRIARVSIKQCCRCR